MVLIMEKILMQIALINDISDFKTGYKDLSHMFAQPALPEGISAQNSKVMTSPVALKEADCRNAWWELKVYDVTCREESHAPANEIATMHSGKSPEKAR
ncbi:hypothetical protein AVEN_192670-1 [Araneus ventricosus]|uniref:Uncharacterized protein n=1 Tax=Araneus ventricosus TaxID=182803 RepID=A0A4Y2RQE8_ARAVE|nr:hypothetical protein AVEN_192670-1 [Araneus ventricosus]